MLMLRPLALASLGPLALAAASEGPGPKQSDLKKMVHIDWRRLPDIPRQGSTKSGFQDSDGGWLSDDTVLTAFGYSSGGIPGFLNTAWIINTSAGASAAAAAAGGSAGARALAAAAAPNTTCSFELPAGKCGAEGGGFQPLMCYTARELFPGKGCTALSCHGVASYCDGATGVCLTNSTPKAAPCIAAGGGGPPPGPPPSSPWQQLPSAPVCGRQEVSAAIVDSAVYYVGGFSYIPSYCFNDTLKLAKDPETGEWGRSKLPDFPYPVSSFGLASVGTDLYLVGGADYDSKGSVRSFVQLVRSFVRSFVR
eukprot:SAG22_NODE_2462_length_2544_cov_1.131288_1_plen_308_part_10